MTLDNLLVKPAKTEDLILEADKLGLPTSAFYQDHKLFAVYDEHGQILSPIMDYYNSIAYLECFHEFS